MTQFTFKRHQRLLTSSQYQAVFDHVDCRVGHKAFLILARKTEPTQAGRLGLVVSKKNLKRAVDRNQFKRHVRNSFRLNQSRFQGLDILVLSRNGALSMPSEALREELEKSWQKLLSKCHNPDPKRS